MCLPKICEAENSSNNGKFVADKGASFGIPLLKAAYKAYL